MRLDDAGQKRLQVVHERLESHFQDLRTQRDLSGRGKPIFALEHGLREPEIEDLRQAVRESLGPDGLSSRWWLPWVVYAAEIGYRYTGEEYWQTFEATTPGWLVRGDRHYIRDRFQEFTKRFGGARPAGAWADQFSIICWPITHSVLPTDLQVQLARLLYDLRRILNTDLVGNPDELGQKLSAGAWSFSSRFQNFAQNTSLLGLVAAALLLGEKSKSSLLLESTLARVVADLSLQREARRWLADAKNSASRIVLRGLAGPAGGTRRQASTESRQLPRPFAIASLFLIPREDSGWTLMVELPDLAPLAAQATDLRQALANSRCVVVGSDRAPLARGQILYPGQNVQLKTWPGKGAALLHLENKDTRLDQILANECLLSSGPVWLFRAREAMPAEEIRGRVVRPGQRYVILSEVPFDGPMPSWLVPTTVECQGLVAYDVRVPPVVDQDDIAHLEARGLSVTSDIELHPIGLVPSAWDGESFAEWIEGDSPILALSSTILVDHFALSLDGAPLVRLEMPADPDALLGLSLGVLTAGAHQLKVVVAPTGTSTVITGALTISIREPRVSVTTGSYREPLVLLANPTFPTLAELWEGRASVTVLGPPGAVASTTVSLERGPTLPVVRRDLREMQLPVNAETWRDAFDKDFREKTSRLYDDGVACTITVSNPELGSTALRVEREFAPLRWGVGEDHDGPFARVHDNIGDPALVIERYEFSAPEISVRLATQPGAKLRCESGGLFVARVREFNAGVVLPPLVRDLSNLARAQVRPKIAAQFGMADLGNEYTWRKDRAVLVSSASSRDGRRRHRVLALMKLAEMWASAALPGSALAVIPRNSVLRAAAIALSSVVMGDRWATLERQIEEGNHAAVRELGSAVGKSPLQLAPWMTIERLATAARSMSAEQRIVAFAGSLRDLVPTLGPPGDGRSLAEGLLRLASSPGASPTVATDVDPVACALTSPLSYGAARLLVLATHLASGENSELGPYRGWEWQ